MVRKTGLRKQGLSKQKPPANTAAPPPAAPRTRNPLSRDGVGRTPLHLVLLRYAAGYSLPLGRTSLRLRRSPSYVVLALLEAGPGAAGVADRDGIMPLYVVAGEAHGGEVVGPLLGA